MSTDISTLAFAIEPVLAIRTPIDLASRFGDIPLARIRFSPPPGLATEADVLELHDRENRLFELVDGTLIEKTMGSYESIVAGQILTALNLYLNSVKPRIGMAMGADGMVRLNPDMIRIPDVSIILRQRFESAADLKKRVFSISPNLAVEVISESNSRGEMERKLDDYFQAGVEEVWYVYPDEKRILRFIARRQVHVWNIADEICDIDILPGFRCPIEPWFLHPDEAFRAEG